MIRYIRLDVDPGTLRFDNAEQVDEFHKAIGRMAMFGIAGQDSDGHHRRVQAVYLTVARDREVTGVYKAVVQLDMWDERERNMDEAMEALSPHGGFVLGALPDRDGKSYSFHS